MAHGCLFRTAKYRKDWALVNWNLQLSDILDQACDEACTPLNMTRSLNSADEPQLRPSNAGTIRLTRLVKTVLVIGAALSAWALVIWAVFALL
jgi:hypothetical protein